MPKGPRGEKRPADVIGAAVKVMRIATGEETEEVDSARSAAAELGSRGGKALATRTDQRKCQPAIIRPVTIPARCTLTTERVLDTGAIHGTCVSEGLLAITLSYGDRRFIFSGP
jgi:hypothetical protein